jgi:hypothetical protein
VIDDHDAHRPVGERVALRRSDHSHDPTGRPVRRPPGRSVSGR